jgi:SulP family sulfate permease
MLFHLSGPMSFSSAKAMVRRHAGTAGYRIMLLDLTEVPNIDFTTTRAIEDIIVDTIDAGRDIFLVGARTAVCDMLEKQDVLRHFDTGHMYQSRLDALLHAKKLLKEPA